ncbi:hypothetical protein PANT_19d00091 [Moesziomyces antarcticus T-34]|uniref:Arrestin C-terminal-like domain-containing protein n=1 Tax=Pseudozyma antarctica (strain T-34) TaxID=1151754 RepID=M9MHG5_PSEA3|nr:hypothetical protein PANT_19d00091 [Moesziomyces antarcticus T-34]
MFAPPSPHMGNRPASAAAHHGYAHPQIYDLPSSPMPQEHRLQRSSSFSWKPELGLPPPPSQIDALGDSIQHALVPHRPASRARSVSPATRVPSRYDLEFGGLEDPTEHRDRTQDHMNMVTKHPKVKIDIVLSSNVFEAGGTLSGKVELTCTTSQRLRLGQIAIELEAVEQLTSRDHAATQLFLYNRTMFQGDDLPPSNAVLPAAPINGYWTARKGRTTFPFSFRLPSSAPSCVTFAGNASLRYGLKATAQTWYNDDKMIVTARREAFVLEKWSDVHNPRFYEPVDVVGDTRLFMGGNGAVWLEAGVTEQLFWGGGQMLVRCGIKNNTKRHLSGIKIALARRLIFPVGSPEGVHESAEKMSLEPRITEIVHDQIFKGRDYEFAPNAESVCTAAVDIPRDLRTIRKTRLFEVRTYALVSLLLGSFAKDLTIEIPIYVAHTASGQPPAREGLDDLHNALPVHSLPQRPHSSMGHSHHHHGHHHHAHGAPVHHVHGAIPQMESGMLEVERLAAERGWSPAPMLNHHNQAGPSVRPASTAPGMIQLPAQAQPFTLGPDGHVQWNPTANSWNASRLIAPADAGHTIQRSMSAAPDVFHNMPPASPLLQGHGGQTAWALPQRSMSVSPGPAQHVQPPAFGHAPQPSGVPPPQFAPTGDNGPSLSAQAPFGGAQPSQPVYQAPIRETLPPMPEPQSITSANLAQFATPPMQSLPSGFPAGGASPIAGLATIDEDGESQAGTVKTLQKLPTMGKNGGGGGKGNSVSRNNIAQFEAMAEAEEDQEEVKRQMIAMGMQPDEDAFSAPTQPPQVIAAAVGAADGYREAVAATSATSTNSRVTVDTAQTSSSASQRPRASDIFQDIGHREVSAEKERSAPVVTMASVEPSATVVERTQESSADSQMRKTGESRVSEMRRSSITSLRRSSSSQGFGLEALETKLARSTTPKIGSSSQSTVVMANVGRTDSTSSPLASPVVRQEEGSRSRKNSALRSAALAREEAERKGVEQQARAAEERARQLEAEKASRAAAAIAAAEAEAATAERAAAEREAKRIRQAEQQRQERERLAEEARRQHELRKLEEARAQEEAQRVAREEQLERERQAEMSASMHRSDGGSSELTVKPESGAIESRRLGNIGAVRSPSSTTSLERIQAAIAPAPSSIAPSVPSKTTRPTFGAPSRTSDRDRVVLKREAVHRIDGWLSNAASPNASHMNTPGTPSASVLSVLAKDEPRASASREDERRSSYSYRSPSQVINPLWEGKAAGSRSAHRSIPASQTMADLVSTKASLASQKAAAEDDEAVPQLSAELRALVDGSEIRSAHRTSTALKDHPISRRLSDIGSTQKPSEADAATASAVSSTEGAKCERHISMPSWPRPGTLNLDAARNAGQGSAAVSSSERRLSRNPEAREVAIPSRVEKTLAAPISGASASDKQPSYDARSARGGKGGRVASVAQLWSKIAGDDEADAANGERSSLAAPQGDSGPRSASPSSASTVKPKARRLSSASGGAPALDFSKKAATPSASVGVTAIVATFGAASSASKPESLKSFTAPQFLNTSVSKPVFAKVGAQPAPNSAAEAAATAASKPEKRPLPKPVLEPGAVPAPTLVRPTAMRASKAPAAERSSRRISTQLLSTFEKEKTPKLEPAEVASVRDMMSKVAVDSTILGALQANDVHDGATLRYADGTEIKMSGRGTTKAIGENKLKSLRAVWGS